MKLMKHLMAALAAVTILSSAHAGTTWSNPGVLGDPFNYLGFTPQATSLWDDLSNTTHTGYPGFPGYTIPAAWSVAIGANSATGTTTAVGLNKKSNGVLGGPYPSSQSIYHGGFLYLPNIPGGELVVEETSPVASGTGPSNDVKSIALQLQTGEALGKDLYNDNAPVLTYTTDDGTFTASLNEGYLADTFNNGDYEHEDEEVEPQSIIINTYYFEWDLGDVEEEITSFKITWQGTQHSQLYGLRLDQSTN